MKHPVTRKVLKKEQKKDYFFTFTTRPYVLRNFLDFPGVVGLMWCVAWWWVVKDSPEQDRSITDAELEYLRTTIGENLHSFTNNKILST